jgi:hypothetical protein
MLSYANRKKKCREPNAAIGVLERLSHQKFAAFNLGSKKMASIVK